MTNNQSLKLDWFKNEENFGTWIWDDKYKFYVYFKKYDGNMKNEIRCMIYYFDYCVQNINEIVQIYQYEENRFYLKEMS